MSPRTLSNGIACGRIVKGCDVVLRDGRCAVYEKRYRRTGWIIALVDGNEQFSFIHARGVIRIGMSNDISIHRPAHRKVKR